MDRDYRQLRRIVLAAKRLTGAERDAYLARLCAGNDSLRREAESLLAHENAFSDSGPGPEPAPPPDRLGRYRIDEEVGRGGMGVVYRASDPLLNRTIALKILPPDVAGDATLRRRFQREARLLAAFTHPNIAVIHSLEEDRGVHFITMEWVPGETMAARLAAGPMPLDEALRVLLQIVRALEAAHGGGIVHRDLKPLNLKITPRGDVKLLDFGIARALGPTGDDATAAGIFAGTPGYASPEQLRVDATDHRTDIWAFGCILYECLAGEPAFTGRTPLDRIAATLLREPVWDRLPGGTPPLIEELVRRCLVKDAATRLDDIAWARERLESLMLPPVPAPSIVETVQPVPATSRDLPVALTGFVGRAEALASLPRHLEEHRLLTLTGPAGCGKTRLALELAHRSWGRFPGGVHLAELAALSGDAAVVDCVASCLHVREKPGEPLERSIVKHLENRRALLLLDNCEHLRDAAADLADRLLRYAPRLRILVTSREPLGLTGEFIFRVTPLGVPGEHDGGSPEALAASEAVQLFLDRVHSVRPGFVLDPESAPHVAQICRRLDGIPLALELAAARARAMGIEEISRRLDDVFRLLTGGSRASLPQHRTLEALIGWSHVLLDPTEQTLFRRLAVFSNGCTADAARAVCCDADLAPEDVLDTLGRLVEKSLVEWDPEEPHGSGTGRYRMLETIHMYAWARLEDAAEARRTEGSLLSWLVNLALEAEPQLSGPGQSAWLGRLAAEHANLRAALETYARSGQDLENGLRLAGALKLYWSARGHWSEARRLVSAMLDQPGARSRTAMRARALSTAGWLAQRQGDHAEARARHEECLSIEEEMGNREGVAHALGNLGNLAETLGEFERARDLHERSLASKREIGDLRGVSASLNNLGNLASRAGDYARARELHDESLAIKRGRGDQRGISASLNNLGRMAIAERRYDEARRFLEEALQIRRALNETHGIADTLVNLGMVAQHQGDARAARSHLLEALSLHHELDNRIGHAEVLETWAWLAARQGQGRGAVSLFAAAAALRDELRAPLSETENSEMRRQLEALRSSLGEPAFAREWERGRSLSRDESVALATGLGA